LIGIGWSKIINEYQNGNYKRHGRFLEGLLHGIVINKQTSEELNQKN
jgi:hypothetical protein